MKKYIRIYKSVLTSLVLAIVLFACESKYKEARQLSYPDKAPMAEGKGVNLKYTDSGKIVSNLISEKVFDYSNQSFPYQKFFDGVKVDFLSKEGYKSTVIADYYLIFIDM